MGNFLSGGRVQFRGEVGGIVVPPFRWSHPFGEGWGLRSAGIAPPFGEPGRPP